MSGESWEALPRLMSPGRATSGEWWGAVLSLGQDTLVAGKGAQHEFTWRKPADKFATPI